MPLTVVPTPIGNLGDMTLRGIEILKNADVVACEDTRNTLRLLNHFGIKVRTISYYEHNEKSRTSYLINLLRQGDKIALVSDAGTPGISDPGYVIIKAAIEENIPVDVLPGANAVIPALLLSGFEPQPFTFVGFPPDKKGERVRFLERFKFQEWPMVFYLSPHKAAKHLEDIVDVFGERRCAMVREISKVYQETKRSLLSELRLFLAENNVKGELVLVVAGAAPQGETDTGKWEMRALGLLHGGMSMKDVVLQVEKEYDLPRNRIKRYLLENLD